MLDIFLIIGIIGSFPFLLYISENKFYKIKNEKTKQKIHSLLQDMEFKKYFYEKSANIKNEKNVEEVILYLHSRYQKEKNSLKAFREKMKEEIEAYDAITKELKDKKL
jgi:beta-lactamase regulating signal transducer with metallopeptidase domain